MTVSSELPQRLRFPAGTRRFLERVRQLPQKSSRSAQQVVIPPKGPGEVRLVTWNIAHGRRRGPHQALQPTPRLHRNVLDVGMALSDTSVDIVALQEADGPSAWSGGFDHVATLARLVGLDYHFRGEHQQMRVGRYSLSYGTALLSRHPMHTITSHKFGENWRDTKGFVAATIPIPEWEGREIDVVSVHLDFLAPSIRRRQIRQLLRVLEQRRHPLVLLGDLNCSLEVEPETMQLLTRQLGLHAHAPDTHFPTYPSIRPVRRIDWVLVSEELAFGKEHFTLPHRVSDHLGVVADLRLAA